MATATRSTRRPYDPGAARTIQPQGNGRFLVESFKLNSDEWYSVDLNEKTCTCPHFIHRIAPALEAGETPAPCKHYEAAEDVSFCTALSIARRLSASDLCRQSARTDLRPELAEAVRIAYLCREDVEPVPDVAA